MSPISWTITKIDGTLFGPWDPLVYDDLNQLVEVNRPGDIVDTYQYNALGHRLRSTIAGYTTRYVYAGDRVVEDNSYTGSVLAWHTVSGPSYGDHWLHMKRWNTAHLYPAYDGTGSAREMVDGSGAVADTYTMDAFGVPLASTGSDPNPYRYDAAWGYLRESSGLYQLGYRFYWPEIGRFVQQDPIGDGMNWYSYVEANPVTGVDPEGLLRGRAFLGCFADAALGIPRGWIDPAARTAGDARARAARSAKGLANGVTTASAVINRGRHRAFTSMMTINRRPVWAGLRAAQQARWARLAGIAGRLAKAARIAGRLSPAISAGLAAYGAIKCGFEQPPKPPC